MSLRRLLPALLLLSAAPFLMAFYLVEPKIIGGVDEPNPPPYIAFLLVKTMDNKFYQCGAVYTGEGRVVTAAHCLFNPDNSTQIVQEAYLAFDPPNGDVGGITLNDMINSTKFTIHPDYTNADFDQDPTNDIALIWVNEDDLPAAVEPVQLADHDRTEQLINDSGLLTALGWGVTESGETSDILQTVDLNIDDAADYRNKGFKTEWLNFIVAAGATNDEKDACFGDSGGPLVQIVAGQTYLVGLTSFGVAPCAQEDTPGGYTRVSAYRDWILGIDAPAPSLSEIAISRRHNTAEGSLHPLFVGFLVILMGAARWRCRSGN